MKFPSAQSVPLGSFHLHPLNYQEVEQCFIYLSSHLDFLFCQLPVHLSYLFSFCHLLLTDFQELFI